MHSHTFYDVPIDANYNAQAKARAKAKEPDAQTPKLFQQLQIRGLVLPNRIVVSPMGMYSSHDGHLNAFHLMHHGMFAFRGAGLTIVEVSAVTPQGRTSPLDAGIWADSHIESFKKVTDFVHNLADGGGGKIGIQLGHSGRKGSNLPIYPGMATRVAEYDEGGWKLDVCSASALPYLEKYVMPREMTEVEIANVVQAFIDAAERAVKAGFDFIEIHAAHGYLISSFLSPSSNHRTDSYGGSYENRIRILVDIVRGIRQRVPESMPLSVRISATEWMEHSPETPQWTIEDSIQLSFILNDLGVDIIDVSSAANNSDQVIPVHDPYYQIRLAERVRKVLRDKGKNMLVAAVGNINSATRARDILEEEQADLALVAKQFLVEPNLVLNWASELGLPMKWPRQYIRVSNLPIETV